MQIEAAALKRRRSVVARTRPVLLLGVAACALSLGAVRAETNEIRTPEPAPVVIPAQPVAPPAVSDKDFSTGAITGDPAAPAQPDAAQPPAAATVTALAPVPAALTALLADANPMSGLKLAKADREALAAFYAARQGEPIWISNGAFSPKAEAARTRISAAAEDALDPKDFKLPAAPSGDAPETLARAEAEFSAAALSYARKAWSGRVAPSLISRSITAEGTPFDAQSALASLEQSHDVAATLDGFNPQHPQFKELKKLLAEARADSKTDPELPKVAFGRLLEPGMDDPRVPALRQRLGLHGAADDLYYDVVLQDAVIEFQKKNKLGASGLVNRKTIAALNTGAHPKSDADLIALNMERWRWMPRDLGAKHVFVDVPAYELHIMQDGASIYDTRVIVGKASNQTPIFSNAIDHIVVNPYWNVPSTIALNEMQGSSLRGFEVVDNRGRPAALDWEGIRTNRLRIRQPPGERNALGNIKFMFPNSHSVYLHDTSSRSLFSKNDRALSHGCVRVDKPLEFADALSGDQGLSGARLKSMVGGKERRLNLETPIPVHLTYFTAWVGANGELQSRNDIYSLDGRLRAALRGEPLPPLPIEAAPRVAKAKPKPRPAEQTAAVVEQPVQQRRPANPGEWLSRLFGGN